MRIKSCNIKAFGNLKGEYTFESGVNSFVQDNGNGKTTLADFIRVMLYGMKTTKANDAQMGDRSRYLPYVGKEMYGGSMTIEVGGEDIVITRTFDDKSNTRDKLYINGEEANESESTIGERYFNIDEDAFRRTIYISSLTDDSESVRATDSINRNMDMMVSDISTVALEEVLASFEKRCDEIQTAQKRKSKGEINKLEDRIDDINGKLSELRNIDENLAVKYTDLNHLREELDKQSERLKVARKRDQELNIWKQIDDYTSRIAAGKEAIEKIDQQYPKGLVSEGDMKSIKEAHTAIVMADSAIRAMGENDQEKDDAYTILSKRYASGLNNDEYERIKTIKREADEEAIRIDTESNTHLQGEELANIFINRVPSDEDMEINRAYALKYKDNENTLQALATMTVQQKLPIVWIIVGIAGVIVGITLLALGIMSAGIAIAAVSIFSVLLALILGKQGANQSAQARAVALNEENSRLENILKRFYAPYGYYDTAFLDYADSLKSMVTKYKEYQQAKVDRDESLRIRRNSVEGYRTEIENYLLRYGVTELAKIEADYNSFLEQKREREAKAKKLSEYEEEKALRTRQLSSLFSNYGFTQLPENVEAELQRFSSDLANYRTITSTIGEIEKTVVKLKEDNGLTTRPSEAEEGSDTITLQNEYDKKMRDEVRLSDEIDADEKQTEMIDNYVAERKEIEEKKERLSNKLALLRTTKEFIVSADKALKDKYIGPVRMSYGSYMSTLLPQLADNIEMDTDYRVKIMIDGIAQDCNHLSQGERTCLEMALRVAVIDNMYKKEKPFLVMDDPFVELDEKNIQKAKTLVSKIAEKYQVIYFSCHESRDI